VSSPPRERLHQHDIDHRGFVDHQQVAGEWIVVATLEAAVLRVDLQEPMDGLGLEAGRLGHALGGAAGRSAEQKPHPLGGKNAEDRHIEFRYAIPSAGPHGLDLDLDSHRLFCACDSGELITLDARSGKVLGQNPLSGSPDVVFFDRVRKRLYVAVGDPGTIDVFDTKTMGSLGSVATEMGAHTFALAPAGNQIYAFLPKSHRAAIYQAAQR